jgi:septum formation protein
MVATTDMTEPTLLLASRSPRRAEILHLAGLAHEAISPGLDDAQLAPRGASPRAWAASMAFLKAQAGLAQWRIGGAGARRLVIGADTICVHEGRILGQPIDAEDARRMLTSFDDTEHEVVTGVAVIDSSTGGRDIFIDRARVWWDGVGPARIEEYVASGLWAGKAGAYNLAERVEAGWPIRYEGSANTIMGLPIEQLRGRLERMMCPPVEPAA